MFLHGLARSIRGRVNDMRLNISTAGTAPAESDGHVYYATISYRCIQALLDRLQLSPNDRFVDVGCGKGRVVCLAARQCVSMVTGIEYSQALVNDARRNALKLRGKRSPVTIAHSPAEEFDYSDSSVLYFFNPFEAPILNTVLHKARTDRAGSPCAWRSSWNPAPKETFSLSIHGYHAMIDLKTSTIIWSPSIAPSDGLCPQIDRCFQALRIPEDDRSGWIKPWAAAIATARVSVVASHCFVQPS